jgi:dTDP-glucose 4,6-dehydratase
MRDKNKYIYLVTGGAGFIGSNFIKYLFDKYGGNVEVINYDLLTYAGNLDNLKQHENNAGYKFVKGDISDAAGTGRLFETFSFDFAVNFAAESHVDRSIIDSSPFIRTNITGTQTLLDLARRHKIKKFVQVSTDEVYGSLDNGGFFTEETPIAPNSPYSASKAAADLLARAAFKTYGMPVVITRCSNNYGPYQFPEKLIPLMIANIINKKELPVYGRGENIRDWLYVADHCAAVDAALHNGAAGEVYNIGGNNEYKNIDIVNLVIDLMEARGYKGGRALIKYVQDRPGHDLRYAIDASKIKNSLGFAPLIDFEKGMNITIDWYLNNQPWLMNIISGEYSRYYDELYLPKYKSINAEK